MAGPRQRLIAALLILIALFALILLVGALNPAFGAALAVVLAPMIQAVGSAVLIATLAVVAAATLAIAAVLFRAANKGQGVFKTRSNYSVKVSTITGGTKASDLLRLHEPGHLPEGALAALPPAGNLMSGDGSFYQDDQLAQPSGGAPSPH